MELGGNLLGRLRGVGREGGGVGRESGGTIERSREGSCWDG